MAPSAKSPLLQQKLNDLALVEQSFQEYIEGHYITTEQVLDVLCRLIPESKLIRNSVIALDGYTALRRFSTVWLNRFLFTQNRCL